MPEKRNFIERIRGNAEWEGIKWLWAAGRSAVISAVYWLAQRVRHIHVDWMGLSILFVLGLIVFYLAAKSGKRPPAPNPETELVKQHGPPSPQELRKQILKLAGGLCALLIEYEKPLDPPLVDDGYAGLGPLPPDEPEIKSEFSSRFSKQIGNMKKHMGERGLLGEKFNSSRIGDALDSSTVRNAEGIREIIKCLTFAAKIMDEKFIRGVPFSFASSATSAVVITPSKDDVFELIWKLKEFHKSLPPCPGVPNNLPDLTAENADRYATQISISIRTWSNQIRHGYAERFSAPVSELIHKLGSKGLDVRALEEYSKCVETDENVSNIIEALQKVASGLEGR